MEKLLCILPYIYLEEPVQIGDIKLMGVPDWQGRNHAPNTEEDTQYLQELSTCFSTTRGLQTTQGGVRSFTYFLLESTDGIDKCLEKAKEAIILLRYSLLRPDSQALDNLESTYCYTFTLPPIGDKETRTYRGWENIILEQQMWIRPKYTKLPLPHTNVDCQMLDTSKLEDIQALEQIFSNIELHGQIKADVLLAMEWYIQSYQKYTARNISGRLVDISTAFETLFSLPRYNKTLEFRKRITEYLGVQEGSILDSWATDFYTNVRSETVHKGKPVSYLFKHPEAQKPHLSFLWSAQKILRECISAKIGLPRHIPNDRLGEDLIPNEIHIENLKRTGSFEKIIANNMLKEIDKLREVYPTGNPEDIMWLGKELLRGYKKLYNPSLEIVPTLEIILNTNEYSTDLAMKYYQLHKEFKVIYPDSYLAVSWGEISEEAKRKIKVITKGNYKQMQLESTIYKYIEFAGWALLMPS
jgi:hypothetical protein